MKSPGLSTCVWLLAIGTTATLLIGAFAHFDPSAAAKATPAPPSLALATQADPPESVGEPTLPTNLSPGLAEIIRLAQAHVDEGVILSFIQNSGRVYAPSAEEILYLSDLGLPQNVIAALFKAKPPTAPPSSSAIAAAPPVASGPDASPSPPAETPDSSYFYSDLAPYGSWVQTPDLGLSWQPTVETINADWSPYLDQGQWVDSDSGWYWQSDYTWGWAAFHYGRWARAPRLGWVWVPGNVWAPAWVAWRSTGSYYGWAPLPPGAALDSLGQLTFAGSALGAANAVPPSSYVFVLAENFLTRNVRRRAVPLPRAAALFAESAVVGNYSFVNNKVFNGGISRAAVAAANRAVLRPVALRSVPSPAALAGVVDRATLAVYRPDPSAAAPTSHSSPLLLNKPSIQPAAAPSAAEPDPAYVADAYVDESSLLPSASGSLAPDVQLPPLRYAGPPLWNVKPLTSKTVAAGETLAQRPSHHRRPGHLDPVERPTTTPPRIEAAAPPAEPHRAVEEPRLPPPEPRRPVTPPTRPTSNPSASVPSSTHR